MGGGGIDTSGLDLLRNTSQGLMNTGQDWLGKGADFLGLAKQQYRQHPGEVLDLYRQIRSGGTPYATALSTGMFDVPVQQAQQWARQREEEYKGMPNMGPVSQVKGVQNIQLQAQNALSQNIMSQIQAMRDAELQWGTQGAQLFGGMGAQTAGIGGGLMGQGLQGIGQYADAQTKMEMQKYAAQGGVMGNIAKSILSMGGLAAGAALGGPAGAAAGGALGGIAGGGFGGGEMPWSSYSGIDWNPMG